MPADARLPEQGTRARRAKAAGVLGVVLLWICGGACTLPAHPFEGATASEEQVRAAFLFQLAQYVDWPADAFEAPDSPLSLCVMGSDRLAATLEQAVRGKTISSRPIVVQTRSTLPQLAGCHVAFLAVRGEKQIRSALKEWAYPPVLLVGEADGFAEWGGMVNLVIASGRVSFEINLAAVERARLELRSQLLRCARIVVERQRNRP